jgi:hypothetical protein
MARKYPLKSFFLTVAAGLATYSSVAAEVACVADVAYRWVKEGNPGTEPEPAPAVVDSAKPKAASGAAPAASPVGGTPSAAPAGGKQGVEPNEQRVRFATIERRGKDEGSVRAGLLIEVNRQKARAHERCKRDHESFGDCVSTKMSTKSSTLNSLSFSARSKVEEALIEECKVQQGRCIAIDSGEPTCRNLAGAAEAAPAGVADASAGTSEAAGKVQGATDKAADKAGAEKAADKAAGKAAESAADKAKSAKKKP